MANAIYPLWKQVIMQELGTNKSLDQVGVNGCYASLVDIQPGKYVYSAAHQFYTSITNVQGSPVPLTNPVVSASGIFSADTIIFMEVTGTVAGAFVITRQNAGANSTWRLVLYEDTDVIGFPVLANGGNIILDWADAGIFQL